MSASVSAASRSDASAIGALLARAFTPDPVMVWAFPDKVSRPRRLERLYDAIVRFEGIPMGSTLIARDTDPPRILAAAVWRPPVGRYRRSWRDGAFALEAGAALGSAMGRMISLGRAVSRAHPRVPHWYLQLLGVDPDAQRSGWGSALVREQLAACDAEHMPACLETTRENIPFYERLGFRVVGEITIRDDAPLQYALWREPGTVAGSPCA